jgi:hypothetical protein
MKKQINLDYVVDSHTVLETKEYIKMLESTIQQLSACPEQAHKNILESLLKQLEKVSLSKGEMSIK